MKHFQNDFQENFQKDFQKDSYKKFEDNHCKNLQNIFKICRSLENKQEYCNSSIIYNWYNTNCQEIFLKK